MMEYFVMLTLRLMSKMIDFRCHAPIETARSCVNNILFFFRKYSKIVLNQNVQTLRGIHNGKRNAKRREAGIPEKKD